MRLAAAITGIVIHFACWAMVVGMVYVLSWASIMMLGTVVQADQVFGVAIGWTLGFVIAMASAILMIVRAHGGAAAPAVVLILCSLAGIGATIHLSMTSGEFKAQPLTIAFIVAYTVQAGLTLAWLVRRN